MDAVCKCECSNSNFFVAQLPILTRDLNPPQSMWEEVFGIISDSRLNFAWLDLMCRAPPTNATEILAKAEAKLMQASETSSLSSLEYSEYYARKYGKKLPASESALYIQTILKRTDNALRTTFKAGTFF